LTGRSSTAPTLSTHCPLRDPETGEQTLKTLTYAFPQQYWMMGVNFNKNLFAQAGLNPEGPPADWTWEDFYHICQKLTVPEEGRIGFWLPTGGLAGWMFPNFVWQAGGDIVREYYVHPVSGDLVARLDPVTQQEDLELFDAELRQVVLSGKAATQWKAAFHEKPGLEALKFYRRLMSQRWTRCREAGCIGKNTVYDLEDEWLKPGAAHVCPVCSAEKTFEELKTRRQVYVGCVIADSGRRAQTLFSDQKKCGMILNSASEDTGGGTNPDEFGIVGPPRGPELWKAPDGSVIYRYEKDTLKYAYPDARSGELVHEDLSQKTEKVFRYVDLRSGVLEEIDLSTVEFGRLKVNFLNADVMHLNNAIWYNVAGSRAPPDPGTAGGSDAMDDDERQALARLDAAWQYLKFGVDRQARAIRTRVYVDNGAATQLRPEMLEEFGYDEYVKLIPESWRAVNRELKKYGRPEPYAPGYKVVAIQDIASPIDKTYTACARTRDADIETYRADVTDDFLAARLQDAGELVNNVRFSTVEKKTMRRRRFVANMVFMVVVVLLMFFVSSFVRHARALVGSSNQTGSRAFTARTVAMAWAFMLPALASILIWKYVPLVRGSVMAFTDYHFLTESRFVWLDNFIKLFHDMDFRNSIVNTLFYVVLSLGFGFVVPIFLAVLLSEIPRGKVFFRIVYYLPHITSGLVITLMWLDFYDSTITGMLNRLLLGAKLIQSDEPVRWLQDTETMRGLLPMLCVILPGIWASAGSGCLIYLAALKGIPDDIYEAGDLDGAGPMRKFRFITLPYIKPLVLINFVGAFIGSFHAAGNILLMTGGGPDNNTMTIGLQIFFNSYLYLKFGYATSMAWVLGAALVGFTLYQLRILKDVKFVANS